MPRRAVKNRLLALSGKQANRPRKKPLLPPVPTHKNVPTLQRKKQTRLLHRALAALIAAAGIIGVFFAVKSASHTRTSFAPAPQTPAALSSLSLKGVTVMLDPGHGGTDSGYRRPDCREDELNYRFAATLANVLRGNGATVLFTVESAALTVPLIETETETPLVCPNDAHLVFNHAPVTGSKDCLHRRAAAVRLPALALPIEKRIAAKGLYFLSIHHDAYGMRSVRGGHVLYDRRDGGPPSLAHVLARKLSEANLARKPYAGQIPTSDARHLGVLNPVYNVVPQRVLLEVATISNAGDREKAQSQKWRWQYARLISSAIAECEQPAPQTLPLLAKKSIP